MSNLYSSFKEDNSLVLNFKLDQFDGPIDLLVELIREKKMDILTLNIADLTYQYLEFVNNNLTNLPIDDISEYMVMASYLTELKSKMLIPMLTSSLEVNETELEIDRLRRQLFLYKQYKDVVGEFRTKQHYRTKFISKKCDDLEEFIPAHIPEAPLPDHIPIEKLVRAWQKIVINMKENEVDKTFVIKVNNIDMDKIESDLIDFVNKSPTLNNVPLTSFINMFPAAVNDIEYQCAIFISLLVLAKDGYIKISQVKPNAIIYISKNTDKINDLEYDDIKSMLISHSELSKSLQKEFETKDDIKEKLKHLIEQKQKHQNETKNDQETELTEDGDIDE